MRRRFLIWLGLVAMAPVCLQGQSCGSADTVLIGANSSQTIQLQIADYFNNNLADPDQGLCGVELQFVHQFSEDLEITLTSPAGQSIQLIGDNTDDQLAFTFFTKWKITFVPCAAMAMPDSGYVAQWNNDQPNNFISGGQYDGTYYPFDGCLEDFNTGPVNGAWTIQITNNPSAYMGAILFVRLIFCDSRGVDCCFARPGQLTDADIATCQGDSNLLLTPVPVFPGGPADTSEYAYTYVISRNGIIAGYDSLADLRTAVAGNYTVCGLSYRRSDEANIPAPDGMLTLDSLRNNLNSFTPVFCGKLTTDCISVLIAAPPPPTELTPTICQGDSFQVGDIFLSTPGTYSITLSGYTGCDSLVNVDLTVIPTVYTAIDSIICQGESVTVGVMTYSTSGFYTDTLSTAMGCDSVVHLNLEVLAPIVVDTAVTICQGDSYTVGDSIFHTTGTYHVTLPSTQGCDSIVNLQLNVFQISVQLPATAVINCINNGVTLDASASQPAGQLSFEWQDLNGNPSGTGPTLFQNAAGTIVLIATAMQGNLQCVMQDTIEVLDNRMPPIVTIASPDTLTCTHPSIVLDGSSSAQGMGISYSWTAMPGHISMGPDTSTPTVDAPGNYTLIVNNSTTGCADTASVSVIALQTLPGADAGEAALLTCLHFQDTLVGMTPATGSNLVFQWSGPCITSILDSVSIGVDCPGRYYFAVTDTLTGCISIDSVDVLESVSAPTAVIDPPAKLNCIDSLLTLHSESSQPVGQLDFSWNGPGSIIDPETPMPTIDSPGDFTLIVTDLINGCKDTAFITVMIDTIPPVADAGQGIFLNCLHATGQIGGGNSSVGPEILYEWTSTEGHFTGPTDQLQATVDTAGVYVLFVTNAINGCFDTSFVIVTADFQAPFANAGPDLEIDCRSTIVTLDGAGSTIGPTISYDWSGPCVPVFDTGLQVDVNCPGEYILSVTDSTNGCVGVDTVEILLDPAAPIAMLEDTAYISCTTGEVVLNTTGTSSGIYAWALDGMPLGVATLYYAATTPGMYSLSVSSLDQSCIDRDSVLVLLECDPMVVVTSSDTINCTQPTATLNAAVTPAGPNYSYEWTAPDPGCILSGQGSAAIHVNCGGAYTLVVTNPLLSLTDTFSLDIVAEANIPVAEAGPPDTITCTQNMATLDGSASSMGPQYQYEWSNFSTGEVVGAGITFTTTTPGTYQLMVTNTQNNCISIDIAQVRLYNIVPTINFGSNVFACNSDTFTLQSFVTPPDPNNTFSWSGPGIAANADSANVQITAIGNYSLTVFNPVSNCSASASVEVTDQICAPCVNTAIAPAFTCLTDSIALQATLCNECLGCTLNWFTDNGVLLSDTNTLHPWVGGPGLYVLTVTDTLGYSTVVNINVPANNLAPVADAGTDKILNCNLTSTGIGGMGNPTGPDYTFLWHAEGGSAISPNNQPVATVSTPDTFYLEVTNTSTGCVGIDTVVVGIDTIPPVADAGPSPSITCTQNLVVLDGGGSSVGAEISYLWSTTAGGSCLSGAGTLSPVASCSGLYTLQVTNNQNGCISTDTVSVLQATGQPTIPPIAPAMLNCIDTAAVLSVALADSISYTYQWCRLDNSGMPIPGSCVAMLNLPVSQAGQYRFELINNASGCRNTATVGVTANQTMPMVDAGPNDTLHCTENSVLLHASAGPNPNNLQIEWTSPEGNPIGNPGTLTPEITVPGVYYVEVTEQTSLCTALDSIVIEIDENAPTAEAGPDSLLNCFHPSIRLMGSGTAASGLIQYSWGGGVAADPNTASPLVNHAGWYYLTVTDPQNGCNAVDSVFVDQNNLVPTAEISGLDTLELSCSVDTITLDAAASTSQNNAALAFQWIAQAPGYLIGDPAATQVQATIAGNFRLIVTDLQNGCRDTLPFMLSGDYAQPHIVIQPPQLINCYRPEITIDASGSDSGPGFVPTWYNTQDIEIGAGNLQQTVGFSGVYTLTIENQANGCSASQSVTVNSDLTRPKAIIAVPDPIDCQQSTSLLNGTASSQGVRYAYLWAAIDGQLEGALEGLMATAGAPGDYQLVVTDTINGCTDTAVTTVTALSLPITGLWLTNTPPNCYGEANASIYIDSVQGGSPPVMYALNEAPFSTVRIFPNLEAGVYTIHAQDAHGCTFDTLVNLEAPLPVQVELGVDLELELGDSIQLEALVNIDNATLRWRPDTAFADPTLPVQIVAPLETAFYSVIATDPNGCTATDKIIVNVIKPRHVFIPTAFSPNGDGQNDRLMIFGGADVKQVTKFHIFDRWGNMVYSAGPFAPNDPAYGWDGYFEGRPVNAAVFAYFAEVEFTDGWIEQMEGEVILIR